MPTTVEFTNLDAVWQKSTSVVVIGPKKYLKDKRVTDMLPHGTQQAWTSMMKSLSPGDGGDAKSTWTTKGRVKRLVIGALPAKCSRYNSPAHPHAITNLVRRHAPKKGDVGIVLILGHGEHAMAAANAVVRAYPLFSMKSESKSKSKKRAVRIAFVTMGGRKEVSLDAVRRVAESVRQAARLVDMPPNVLTTQAFIEEAKTLAKELDGVELTIIEGETLETRGFGGHVGVGQAATLPPALVHLSYTPKRARKTIVWVGKGIVYDTGGLSLKTTNGMVGMKRDMGGAAAVFGAFRAAVLGGTRRRLHAVLCLAENSVGPNATRPDDIITLYSGRTVEVNNTDAEGRLVLGDGVAYAAKDLKADVIVDLATLTGAQMIATGRRIASIICNDDGLEKSAVKAGRRSGDLVHPLPYCPEFFQEEFRSIVADMKNSVKDRANGQVSCAGQFVANHLIGYKGQWLHVDIAGPAHAQGRGTGFGVGLLVDMLENEKL